MAIHIHIHLPQPPASAVTDGIAQILKGQQKIMPAIDDLKTAVARVGASTSAEIKAVSDKLTAIGSNDPAIADAVKSLNAAADTLDAETATLTGAPAVTGTGTTADTGTLL